METRRIRKVTASEFVYNSIIFSAAGTVAEGNYVSSTSVPEPTKIRFPTGASKRLVTKCSPKTMTALSVDSNIVSSAAGKEEEVTPGSSTPVPGLTKTGSLKGFG